MSAKEEIDDVVNQYLDSEDIDEGMLSWMTPYEQDLKPAFEWLNPSRYHVSESANLNNPRPGDQQ